MVFKIVCCGVAMSQICVVSPVCAQPGDDGGAHQPCLYEDHWEQIPEMLKPFVIGHSVLYDVVVAEDVWLVFEGEVLHDSVQVDAECVVRECPYDPGNFEWGYSQTTGKEYTVGASANFSVSGELAVKVLAKLAVEAEFVLEGQYTRSDKQTQSYNLSIPIDMCYDKHRGVYKRLGVAAGWRQVVSQRYVWELDLLDGFTTTTDCNGYEIDGDADKVDGWRLDPTSTPCPEYPECGIVC